MMRRKPSEFKGSIYKGEQQQQQKTVERCKTEDALGVHFKNKCISRAVKREP